MELKHIKISQYVNGFVATGYDDRGQSILDGEPKQNQEAAVNSLIDAINATEAQRDE